MDITRRSFLQASGLLGIGALTGCGLVTPKAIKTRPNVLLIVADDMGFSDAGCYGGEVRTPVLDKLADSGLRFTQHYSTGRCWPSRACILTGYYAQHIRRDNMKGIKMGDRPGWAKLLPELLKQKGYRSYHSGKWHIDGTPTAGGFDRSWGSEKTGCDWNRFFDSKPWQEGPYSAPVAKGQDYYSTIAIADHAIACLKLHRDEHPQQPFFQYLTFYSPHFPLHALQKDIDSYSQAYDKGWDVVRQQRLGRMKKLGIVDCKLSKRQPDVKPGWNLSQDKLTELIGPGETGKATAWEELTDEQKTFQAKKMEIHAAMISRMDTEIGRVIEQLKAMGQYDNTLILFVSDNGASAEQMIRGNMHDKTAVAGSADSYLCLGPGWATASNTPFRFHKHWTHEGGISSPLIAHWPEGIRDKGKLRHDASHFIDIVPTVIEVAGAKLPEIYNDTKTPARPGISMVNSFAKDGSLRHEDLWWCHADNKAIRIGDWKLSARANKPWELYDLSKDRSETNDLAAKHPEKVKEMDARWNRLAESFKADNK